MAELYFDLHLLSLLTVKIDLITTPKLILDILRVPCSLDTTLQFFIVIPTFLQLIQEFQSLVMKIRLTGTCLLILLNPFDDFQLFLAVARWLYALILFSFSFLWSIAIHR